MDYRFWMYEHHERNMNLDARSEQNQPLPVMDHFPILTWYLVSGLVVIILVSI